MDVKQYSLKILGFYIFTLTLSDKSGWFRLFGKGLVWKHKSLGLLFSERIGKTKYFKIFNYIIKITPNTKWN